MIEINKINLNNDGIGYVAQFDFSSANKSYESRVQAITTIASVCYANPKVVGSIKLYDRLATESKGLPSSSYEFVPILIDTNKLRSGMSSTHNVEKYGELVEDGRYLLTNLRALISDVGEDANKFFNTSEEEITIIKKHFKVFKSKIDLSTARQFMRHRVSWQELSRRYVSGKREPFEFYVPDSISGAVSILNKTEYEAMELGTVDLFSQCVRHYDELIKRGIKPENARRVLPQSMYTTMWSAWQPKQIKEFFKLRIKGGAQKEIEDLAIGMRGLLGSNKEKVGSK